MTKIKLCGLKRPQDIEMANTLKPDYIGFVFAPKSRRYVSPQEASDLKEKLSTDIQVVGVLVNEPIEHVVDWAQKGVIDIIQLHGQEDADYIRALRQQVDNTIFQAFSISSPEDVRAANESLADYILLDSGQGGTGTTFNWELLQGITRPYFLAGGLNPDNASEAVHTLHPYGLDVSSGIETDGIKDPEKMTAFVSQVRKAEQK